MQILKCRNVSVGAWAVRQNRRAGAAQACPRSFLTDVLLRKPNHTPTDTCFTILPAGFAKTYLGLVDSNGNPVNGATAGPGGSSSGGQEYRFAVLLSNQALLGGPSFPGVNGPPARGTTAFLRMRVCFHTLLDLCQVFVLSDGDAR